ncbi:MAG: phosphatase PAP2 family protein [Gaiellaceae bacterium]
MQLLRRNARWIGPSVYFCALGISTYFFGVAMARDRVLVWILLGLFAFSLTNLRHLGRGLVYDWAPFIVLLFIYDILRGRADKMGFAVHTWPQLRADRWLGAGHVPTVWLQTHLWHGAAHISWYDYALWFVYLTHFFATLLVAALLWAIRPRRFRRYMAAVVTLAMLGFTTYALFPASPPWMASNRGALPPLQRIVAIVWQHIPVSAMSPLFERGSQYANNVAAMPSLHAAYALLIVVFFWKSARWYWRIPLAIYPLAMGFALVYMAEHYVVDVIAGWIYALVAYVVVVKASNWLSLRSARKELQGLLDEPLPETAAAIEDREPEFVA